MSKIALTDISVRALKAPAQGQTTVWDKNSPIGVRVSQGGSKTFIVMIGSGQRRTIGRVGIITLSDARGEAKRILAERTLGIAKKVSTITFASALPQFLEENYKGRKPRTKQEAKRLLEKHLLPALRNTALAEVTDTDIGRQLDKLSHAPSEKLHCFRAARAFLRWCTRPPRRYIPHSPLEGYEAPSQDGKRNRILTDNELVAVWYAATGSFGAMVKLLILWGVRKGEVGRLSRTWMEDGVLTIPGAFTKNGRAHAVPLLPMARTILETQTGRGNYFFPGRWDDDTHFGDGSWGKLKRELDERSGVNGWTIHDLRRTFRSNMARLRVPRELAEILLNHVTGANKSDLDEIYDRYDYIEEKRAALAKWEARLTDLLAR